MKPKGKKNDAPIEELQNCIKELEERQNEGRKAERDLD